MSDFGNVFILCTGRCGSTTMVRACKHISNYTAGHETRTALLGKDRFAYPKGHIEADNRLSWLLGRLDEEFGKDAFYVHLRRDRQEVAESYSKRSGGILRAYMGSGILMDNTNPDYVAVAGDMVDTISSNIEHFLQDKPHKMEFWLERAKAQLPEFFERIGAQGDLDAALDEFDVKYNATKPRASRRPRVPLASRALRKLASGIEKTANR